MLILVANELNIPTQSVGLPNQFKKLLQPNKLDGIIILGQMNDKITLDYFRSLCDKVIIGASGSTLMLDSFKVGLICDNQTQSYELTARKLDVDMLLIAGPKSFEAYERDSTFYCSPGSMTGTYSSLEEKEAIPSFILLDIQPDQVTVFVYSLIDEQIKVDKIEYSKEQDKPSEKTYQTNQAQPTEESTLEPEVQRQDERKEQEEQEEEGKQQVENDEDVQLPAESSRYEIAPAPAETDNLWNE
ncbi:hypothetical protein E3Q11_00065 [Wallemia mellicola]|nr:hypothetical protein E3Q11_00065 [Wallemia mellicola]